MSEKRFSLSNIWAVYTNIKENVLDSAPLFSVEGDNEDEGEDERYSDISLAFILFHSNLNANLLTSVPDLTGLKTLSRL